MRIKVYQIDPEKDERALAFCDYSFAEAHGGVKPEDYKCVFYGYLHCTDLEGVFTALNSSERPGNYRGHSLSKSDIVVVETDVEPDWGAFVRKASGKTYLYARMTVGQSFVEVLQHEMNCFLGTVTDGIGDGLQEEKQAIRNAVGKEPNVSFKGVVPYLMPLIDQMVTWIPKDMLKHYGWTEENVRTAIIEHIEPQEFREALQKQINSGKDVSSAKVRALCEEVEAICQRPDDNFKDHTSYVPFVKRGAYFCDTYGFRQIEFDTTFAEGLKGIRCLEIQPGKSPFETCIPNELRELQNAVSRYGEPSLIEVTYPFDDNAVVLGNEEAKLNGMEGNRHIGGQIYAGPLYIIGDDIEGNFTDLTDEQIQTYGKRFAEPEYIPQEAIEEELSAGYFIL